MFQTKIEQLHEAVVKGDLKSVQSQLTRRKLALSKDENGHGLLHKVVYFGHRHIYDWMMKQYPETLETRDWVRNSWPKNDPKIASKQRNLTDQKGLRRFFAIKKWPLERCHILKLEIYQALLW